MGCHTWFYKKVNPQPTEEDKIQQFLAKTKSFRQKLVKATENGGFEYDVNKKEWYPYNKREDVENAITDIDWMLQHVNEYKKFDPNIYSGIDYEIGVDLFESVNHWLATIDDDSRDDFWDKNAKYDDLTMSIDGIYYSNVRRYDDIFRYHNYDSYVMSEDEMWKLIEDNNIEITEGVKDKLKEFWSLYPDGMIYFG